MLNEYLKKNSKLKETVCDAQILRNNNPNNYPFRNLEVLKIEISLTLIISQVIFEEVCLFFFFFFNKKDSFCGKCGLLTKDFLNYLKNPKCKPLKN